MTRSLLPYLRQDGQNDGSDYERAMDRESSDSGVGASWL